MNTVSAINHFFPAYYFCGIFARQSLIPCGRTFSYWSREITMALFVWCATLDGRALSSLFNYQMFTWACPAYHCSYLSKDLGSIQSCSFPVPLANPQSKAFPFRHQGSLVAWPKATWVLGPFQPREWDLTLLNIVTQKRMHQTEWLK